MEKKKKRFRNSAGLIIPKSTSLFLINLDDILILHPQLIGKKVWFRRNPDASRDYITG